MHIAILDANTDTSDLSLRSPDERGKFRALLAGVAPDWTYASFKVHAGEFPETLAGFDGIIVSGSPASANDPDPWVERLLALVRHAVDERVPVFGACFGHQAVARALGGSVAHNPAGWQLGRVETRAHTPAPWMDGDLPVVALHAAHKEQVTAPPPGARVLGGTDSVPYGHLAVGDRVFTTQYHPEFTAAFMAGLIDEMDGTVDASVIVSARFDQEKPTDAPQMARWIANFFRQARG